MIDWSMVASREEIETIYKEHRSIEKVSEILGVDSGALRRKMVLEEIPIQPRGHPRPTKLDLFRRIPEKKLRRMSDEEVAKEIGSAVGTAYWYRYVRLVKREI